jgi:hypothetical protein
MPDENLEPIEKYPVFAFPVIIPVVFLILPAITNNHNISFTKTDASAK